MFDTDMRYLQVSDRFLTDYDLEGHDLIGKSHYEVFPDLPARWREAHRRILTGAVERCEEDSYIAADGSMGWLQWESLPWRNVNGEIGGLILFTQVITARKRAEEHCALRKNGSPKSFTLVPFAWASCGSETA
jgi:PAS domain S-box-containing protein